MSVSIEKLSANTDEATKDSLLLVLKQLSSSVTLDSINAALMSAQSELIVAKNEHVIVGTATMAYVYCFTGIRAHIEDVVVDEKWRGKGVAKKLLAASIDSANEKNARTIDLTSRPDREAANRLYQKMGFVKRETNVYRLMPTT
jgi:ribosomal protein S18 acetylase RimI-like enzyme